MPQMIILEETTEEHAEEKERVWIARFKSPILTNSQQPAPKGEAKPAHAKCEPEQTLKVMAAAERDMIVQMLRQCHGNKLEASKRLGIGRQTLYNKITLYNIEEARPKSAKHDPDAG